MTLRRHNSCSVLPFRAWVRSGRRQSQDLGRVRGGETGFVQRLVARFAVRDGAGRKPGSVARIDAEARQRALAGGEMPLDFLLSVMRDDKRDFPARLDAAKAAAPYC